MVTPIPMPSPSLSGVGEGRPSMVRNTAFPSSGEERGRDALADERHQSKNMTTVKYYHGKFHVSYPFSHGFTKFEKNGQGCWHKYVPSAIA